VVLAPVVAVEVRREVGSLGHPLFDRACRCGRAVLGVSSGWGTGGRTRKGLVVRKVGCVHGRGTRHHSQA
jgi:hypothetical protein